MKKSQFSHWVLPLATVCSVISSSSVVAQEYHATLQGQFTPSCGGGFFESTAKEGMPFQFEVELSIDLLMGEPVVRSSAAWSAYGFGASCIQPYNQEGLVRIPNLQQYDPDGKSHPYNMDLVGEIVGPSVQGQTFISFNPGALSARAGEQGYNTSGSPNWDRMFFSMPSGSYDFWNPDLYQYLPPDAAKEIFSKGFSVTDVTVADVDFDMTEAKGNFSNRDKVAKILETVAKRLAGWGRENFEGYPEDVIQRIVTDAALPVPDNAVALRKTIDDIQALHSNLARKSGKENVQPAMDALHKNLQPFLQAVDEPETKEEFWQIHFKPEIDAAKNERDAIASEVAALALEAKPEPEVQTAKEVTPARLDKIVLDYKYEAKWMAEVVDPVAIGIYETDCGKAVYSLSSSPFNKQTGLNSFSVTHNTPICGSERYYERKWSFRFFVSNISAYNISGDKLTIGFDEKSLLEYYYTTDTLPETHDVKSSELVIWLDLDKERAVSRLIDQLDKLVSNRPN